MASPLNSNQFEGARNSDEVLHQATVLWEAKQAVDISAVLRADSNLEEKFAHKETLKQSLETVQFTALDVVEQADMVSKAAQQVDTSTVLAADLNGEEKFVAAQRKQNLAHRSQLLNALDLAVPFNHPFIDAQAAAVQAAAGKASRATVKEALVALEKRANQTFTMFKPDAPSKTEKKFDKGDLRKINIRANMETPDLGVLSESARARVELKPTTATPISRKH
jgi:hypothetical protein